MKNQKKPLMYTDGKKDQLEELISGFTYDRTKRWSSNKTLIYSTKA